MSDIGKVLQNRYEIIDCLGQGGMGAVYKCIDSRLKCKVAVKLMISDSEFSDKRFDA